MPNINKNIIKQAGAAVANATNKAAGLSASTPEPGSIISAIQLVNGGRTIGPDALAHFTESVRHKLLSLLVTMEPVQDFNGYGQPWPAGGGKNMFRTTATSKTENGVTWAVNEDGSITATGTATGATTILAGAASVETSMGKVAIRLDGLSVKTNIAVNYVRLYNANGNPLATIIPGGLSYIQAVFDLSQYADAAEIRVSLKRNNNAATNGTVHIQVEKGTSYTDWTPYSNICPISGRPGANGYISPTPNVADATTYTADWTTPAGTVYAGSVDIVAGDIKAAPYYASYNGETLVGPWVSSMDEYDPEGTPTTGAQVVDLGGTMTDYHITGQDIITLVGDNYIWSDSGDVTITE